MRKRHLLMLLGSLSLLRPIGCSGSGGGGGCSFPSPTQMMSDSCEADYTPTPDSTGTNPACAPVRGVGPEVSCKHRGNFWTHDWAADCYGNQFYRTDGPHSNGIKDDWGYGCDADVKGKGFDGIIQNGAKAILFEMKTGRLSKADGSAQCSFLTDIIKNDIIADVKVEEQIASDCGYDYQLVLTDQKTFDWADSYFVPPHKVKVVFAGDSSPSDCGPANLPAVPDEYRTRSVDLSEMFWRDELQRAAMHDGGR